MSYCRSEFQCCADGLVPQQRPGHAHVVPLPTVTENSNGLDAAGVSPPSSRPTDRRSEIFVIRSSGSKTQSASNSLALRPIGGDTPLAGDGSNLAKVAAALWPLSAHPFREVSTVGDLIDRGLPPDAWLSSCGVYAVIVPADYQIRVLDFPIVAEAQNVVVPLSADRLRAKWVPGTRVVYIGIAGNTNPRTLRQQLKDMINHAAGDTTDRGPHRKGEALWQLEGYENFMVMAATTAEPPAPRELEESLLERFQKRHGTLPFGNRGNAEPEQVRTPPPGIVRDVYADAPPMAVKPTSAPLPVTVPTPPTSAKSDTTVRTPATTENASMQPSPKPSVSNAIDSAFIRAHSAIVLEAMKAAPSDTTLGELMQALKLHGLADAFLATSLGQLRGESTASRIAAIGYGHDDDDDDDEEQDETPARSATTPAPKKLSMRTQSGRESLDTEVEGVLKKAGRMRAENLRAQIGGTSQQVRESLKRLMSLGLVRTEGERRATTYIWASR